VFATKSFSSLFQNHCECLVSYALRNVTLNAMLHVASKPLGVGFF